MTKISELCGLKMKNEFSHGETAKQIRFGFSALGCSYQMCKMQMFSTERILLFMSLHSLILWEESWGPGA